MSLVDELEALLRAEMRDIEGQLSNIGRLGRPKPRRPDAWRNVFAYGFVGVNSLVFAGWLASREGRRPKLRRFLEDNFALSNRNLRAGRWWTRVTSAISHQAWDHFANNMFAFWVYVDCALLFGYDEGGLAALALGSAVAGSAAQLWDWDRRGLGARVSGLGASAVVNGLGTAVTVLRPLKLVEAGWLPVQVPLWLYTLGYFAYDYYSMGSATSRVGHAAHVGGVLFGAAFGVLQRLRSPSTPRAFF